MDPGDGYERFPHPSLMNIPSINSLKRSNSQVDQAPYTEMVQDLRDDDYKRAVLSFKKVEDKHTIVDQKGRIYGMEISAQLHGMFFLSEFPSGAGDGSALNAELTCYRRNLFQISGSLCFPQIPLSVMLETGETDFTNTQRNISRFHRYTAHALESWGPHPVGEDDTPYAPPPLPPPRLAPIDLSGTSRSGIWRPSPRQSETDPTSTDRVSRTQRSQCNYEMATFPNKISNSFKDRGPAPKHIYGQNSPRWKACRDRLDNAFAELPVPKPSHSSGLVEGGGYNVGELLEQRWNIFCGYPGADSMILAGKGNPSARNHKILNKVAAVAAATMIISGPLAVTAQHAIPGAVLHVAVGTALGASVMIPPLRNSSDVVPPSYAMAAYGAWAAAFATLFVCELLRRPNALQRRLLGGTVLLSSLNLLGTLSQSASSTIEGILAWGPLALTVSLVAVAAVMDIVGNGPRAAVDMVANMAGIHIPAHPRPVYHARGRVE